jgi:DNA topoisomerase-1
MKPALYDTLVIRIRGDFSDAWYRFRVSASSLKFPGFLKVYEEWRSKRKEGQDLEALMDRLPDLQRGDPLNLIELFPTQHFTQPPARYSDASLVQALEKFGIGRPSTYAPIISTLKQRGYVVRRRRRLEPTEIGELVTKLLVEHFGGVVDYGFTARMEDELDDIADGDRAWVDVVKEFYEPFAEQLALAKVEMPEVKAEPQELDRKCPECGQTLVIRHGRYGKFIGCSNFPDCRHTEPWLEKIGVTCPDCDGSIVERRTRRGRLFYGCDNYPDCEFTSWKRPLEQACPLCEGLLVADNRDYAKCISCETRFPHEEIMEQESSVA